MSVDFTPKALQRPMDPRTEKATMTTPDNPSSTCKGTQSYMGVQVYALPSQESTQVFHLDLYGLKRCYMVRIIS
jgi:hypothetical protein